MLDAHAKPWLLEVNLDPALRTESPLDLKIKSQMLIDLLNVVGMPVPSVPEDRGPPGGSLSSVRDDTASSTHDEQPSFTSVDEEVIDVSEASCDGPGGGENRLGTGHVPTRVFEDAHQAAADWKRRRAADVLRAQCETIGTAIAYTYTASQHHSMSMHAMPRHAHTRHKSYVHRRSTHCLRHRVPCAGLGEAAPLPRCPLSCSPPCPFRCVATLRYTKRTAPVPPQVAATMAAVVQTAIRYLLDSRGTTLVLHQRSPTSSSGTSTS